MIPFRNNIHLIVAVDYLPLWHLPKLSTSVSEIGLDLTL